MESAAVPLLSICIPTYNRSRLLESALLSLAPQISRFSDTVELIVSDNHSPDRTPDIIKRAQAQCPIRSYRNTENIGAVRNMLKLVGEYAIGEYCWLIGDDDFVRDDGLERVLNVLANSTDIDFVCVNGMHVPIGTLDRYQGPVVASRLPADLALESQDTRSYAVDRWEHLITPGRGNLFMGMQRAVFRRTIWCKSAHGIDVSSGSAFSSLELTYPHIVVFARGFVGRKAYHIGTPVITIVDGAREWWDYQPMIVLVRLQEALDLYAEMGVERPIVRECQDYLLAIGVPTAIKVLRSPNIAGREYWSLRHYVARFWRHKRFWTAICVQVLGAPRSALRRFLGLCHIHNRRV